MKKKVIAAILSAAMVIGLTACGSSQAAAPAAAPAETAEAKTEEAAPAAEEKQEAASGEAVTLSFMASQDWVQDAELELAEKFTAETGIKVDYQIVPSDQYTNLLMTKLNTG